MKSESDRLENSISLSAEFPREPRPDELPRDDRSEVVLLSFDMAFVTGSNGFRFSVKFSFSSSVLEKGEKRKKKKKEKKEGKKGVQRSVNFARFGPCF